MNNLKTIEMILGKGRVRENIELARYTTFKMGGQAEFYFEALTKEDLIATYAASKTCGLSLTILGGGSNVVISDQGVSGLVVRNLFRKKEIVQENDTQIFTQVSSGYPMSALVKETVEAGWSGLEYHLGLPGTVGGAVYMNSKWTHPTSYISDAIISAELIDQRGESKTVEKSYFQFAYDFSIVQKTKEIVLTVTFMLEKSDTELVKKRAEESLAYRKKTQPFGVFSSGCFFKNVNGKSMGQLVDELGLKGLSVGEFSISDKHGNFIIHKGNGKRGDLEQLLSIIKIKAKEKYRIELEEEVVFI